MSDDVLSVIPADPYWRPDEAAAGRLAAVVAELAPGGADVGIEVTWHETLAVVDCGVNLERIGCPLCGGSIDREWWADLVEARSEDGFATLAVEAPCCGGATALDALTYDWPCGFARFEIAVWNPERAWFSEAELAVLGDALGHPVQQIRAHIQRPPPGPSARVRTAPRGRTGVRRLPPGARTSGRGPNATPRRPFRR